MRMIRVPVNIPLGRLFGTRLGAERNARMTLAPCRGRPWFQLELEQKASQSPVEGCPVRSELWMGVAIPSTFSGSDGTRRTETDERQLRCGGGG